METSWHRCLLLPSRIRQVFTFTFSCHPKFVRVFTFSDFSPDLSCSRTEVFRNLSPALQMPFKIAGFILGKSSRWVLEDTSGNYFLKEKKIFRVLTKTAFSPNFNSCPQLHIYLLQARGPDLRVPGVEARPRGGVRQLLWRLRKLAALS